MSTFHDAGNGADSQSQHNPLQNAEHHFLQAWTILQKTNEEREQYYKNWITAETKYNAEVEKLEIMTKTNSELVDECQHLRNTLAMSSGGLQSFLLDDVLDNLMAIKAKVKPKLLRNGWGNGDDLWIFYLYSFYTFREAERVFQRYIDKIEESLGCKSQNSPESITLRAQTFIKSVLQINYSSIENDLVERTKEKITGSLIRKGNIDGSVVNAVLSRLGLGPDDLTAFALKIRLLQPPVKHQFDPNEAVSETSLIGKFGPPEVDKIYLFPAILQRSKNGWLPTKAQLTFVE
ncbi:hypothetical protein BC938DRAFT_472427 [Jimgerdemannia flammicorona]|uniref:Uncharacterized protein n=1 Tax=Jimgerdemannia flammicorona TaxID=994334 RepID=A0A433R001_9FUNG|nr:hypothetical protein BC938DRAFT_472427 [Jimgerdemannia flammicorona]